jgi:glycosyltransferase involved in cell wall biosynthesis/GT2 family glycosyltransferase
MTDMSPVEGALKSVRRFVSQLFWRVWNALPISGADRRRAIHLLFRRTPFIVFWTASYRNWKEESSRHAEQMARIEKLREDSAIGIAGRVPVYRDPSALPRPDKLLARAIAFYLPQFHPIPENDRWWGKGFTEWVNVRRARPQFQGHRQPRRPGELGYYDLIADASTRRRQAALAHQYGLAGFCFYFYWFSGKTLLETPIRNWADDETITFPFCLCWANESWSRRWDGREDQKLITQYHSPEDDIAFIRHIADYLQSNKYLKVNGRPLVIVYRPGLLPDPAASAKRWRTWCREHGIGEIYLAYTLSFLAATPEEYGFDAAIEFPPNNMGLEPQEGLVQPTSDEFEVRVYNLSALSLRSSANDCNPFRLFRGVTPQWDNTARRMSSATAMLDGGPATYEAWLRRAALSTVEAIPDTDERLVFINAWNEWAEGAYIEPDLDYGHAWLDATRAALSGQETKDIEPGDLVPAEPMIDGCKKGKVIIVVHDLWSNGAQIHSLHLLATYREKFGLDVATIACGDGPLHANFEHYGDLVQLSPATTRPKDIHAAISQLHAAGYSRAIINSSAGGWITPYLSEAGIRVTGLVHEMPDLIRRMGLEEGIRNFDQQADHVVFSSDLVRKQTETDILGHPWSRSVLLPQGHYKAESILHLRDKEAAAAAMRLRLRLPGDARIVIGVGYGDHRKGPDIFCRWALACVANEPRLNFVWIGALSADMRTQCHSILANAGDLANHVHLVGFQSDTGSWYRAAEAYALTSREDPFPSTVLEALACGAPAFIVDGTTGLTEIALSRAITVLPDAKPEIFAAALKSLMDAPSQWRAAATAGVHLVRESFGFCSFAGDLLRLSGAAQPRVSVIIPNYNYARFLPHRIATILNQEHPVWEIIFLDDASQDDSVAIAEELLKDCGINYRVIVNDENSGSVFAQWKKGVDLARGDIVWIAEADDWASARFTKTAAKAFEDPDVVLSYTQSNQVDQDSNILCPHYLDYVADIDRERWRRPFINDGAAELDAGLSVKNTIPNASGVLFRREALASTLALHMDEIRSYRVAGDWCVYAHLAKLGKIAFDPRPLNYHRRHAHSVTISRFTQFEWDEIARMQARVAELGKVSPVNAVKAAAYLSHLLERLQNAE